MPVDLRILKPHGILHVVYHGDVTTEDSVRSFNAGHELPNFVPTLHRLIDLTHVTSITRDPVQSLKLHAHMIDEVMALDHPIMMVYLAPTKTARDLCCGRVKSWGLIDNAIACLVDSEAAALEILGLSVRCIDELYATTL